VILVGCAAADAARNYLAISPSWMSKDGMECDRIGVQPRAFYEQPERCYRPRGSCLDGGRQPERLLRDASSSSSDSRRGQRRLLVEDYVRGATAVRFDGASEQLIVDGRVSPRAAAADDDVTVRGVGEIALDDNAAIVHDRSEHVRFAFTVHGRLSNPRPFIPPSVVYVVVTTTHVAGPYAIFIRSFLDAKYSTASVSHRPRFRRRLLPPPPV